MSSHPHHRFPNSQLSLTLEDLASLCQELRELSQAEGARSRTMICLNQLFVGVEGYLSVRGLGVDAEGVWQKKHWGYTLLEGLAERIETCKENDLSIGDELLSFVEGQLLPHLAQRNLQLI